MPNPDGPSEAAIGHAADRIAGNYNYFGSIPMDAVYAAHDPVLGLDRSVRLGDVVEDLRAISDGWVGVSTHEADSWRAAAERVARRFGGSTDEH